MPQIKLQKNKPIVMSIGGSLIVPSAEPDSAFLKKLKVFVDKQVRSGKKILIVTGGGKTARHYIDAASKSQKKKIDPEDLDWLGIHATRMNAHLLRTIFRDIAHPVVIKDPTKVPKKWKGNVLIGAGWKPGWSTDYVACRMAKKLGVKNVLNASNIDYVFDKDPRKHKDAKPFDEMKWKDYRKIVGNKWNPGLSAPFDPVASRFCHKNCIDVAIVNGKNLVNISRLISEKSFKGTVLK